MSEIISLNREKLEALVRNTHYHRVPDTTVTICAITLKNGFTVVGESACIDPNNFDQTTGQRIAYENAFEKLWQLEGYRIKSKLAEQA